MKVICPEHQGVIYTTGSPVLNNANFIINNLVVECPVCDVEVLIDGVYAYDSNGIPTAKSIPDQP